MGNKALQSSSALFLQDSVARLVHPLHTAARFVDEMTKEQVQESMLESGRPISAKRPHFLPDNVEHKGNVRTVLTVPSVARFEVGIAHSPSSRRQHLFCDADGKRLFRGPIDHQCWTRCLEEYALRCDCLQLDISKVPFFSVPKTRITDPLTSNCMSQPV